MAANAPQAEADCTCPVCCDLFTDPVVLLCGHSFCKYCIQEWWRQSSLRTCPVCKEIFLMSKPPPNIALKNLSDSLRREKEAARPAELCHLHGEKLKLFCLEDQQPICLVCRDAKAHKKHNCVPIGEVAEEYRVSTTQTDKPECAVMQKVHPACWLSGSTSDQPCEPEKWTGFMWNG